MTELVHAIVAEDSFVQGWSRVGLWYGTPTIGLVVLIIYASTDKGVGIVADSRSERRPVCGAPVHQNPGKGESDGADLRA